MRATTEPPEAAGPGTDLGNGEVVFGRQADNMHRVYIPPRRDPEEVARERARIPYRCGFCADIPTELLAAIREAMDQARKEAPR
jgi:hypothetical protein